MKSNKLRVCALAIAAIMLISVLPACSFSNDPKDSGVPGETAAQGETTTGSVAPGDNTPTDATPDNTTHKPTKPTTSAEPAESPGPELVRTFIFEYSDEGVFSAEGVV